MFSPSAAVATARVLWRLLTSVRSVYFLKQGYEVTSPSAQISPGKNAIFLSSICSIYSHTPLAVWTLVCYATSSSLR
ncbi:hypothetical protein [Paenibacillus pseudetheri]|uniref:hypothetical protein n=1 Tax=Paenibacillus pseudetheri TaxID=2897682 RepID=UPI001F37836A|nr:hypothetical protein [Paenibacillus pseudetheri]